MAITERLALIVTANPNDAVRGLQKLERTASRSLGATEQRIDRIGQRFTQAGAVMLTAGGVAAAGLLRAGMAAGELEQAVGGTEAVFGEAADVIEGYGRTAARSMGLSETAFRTATTRIGGNLKRMGLDVDQAADRSVELTQIAADLAATYGGTTAEAVEALGAAFRGEADPAERFNLNLKASEVNAKAVELGLAETEQSVSEYARAQALLALITEQSADAQGQFAREQGTAAGQMQIARAEWDNFLAVVGQEAAPIIADAAGLVSNLAGKFNQLPDGIQGGASRLAVFTTGALLAGGAVSTVVGQLVKMRDQFTTVGADGTRSMTKLGKSLTALGVVGVVASLYEMGQALTDTNVNIERFANATEDDLAQAVRDIGPLFQESNELGDELAQQLIDGNVPAAERFADAMDAAGLRTDYFREQIEAKRESDAQAQVDQAAYADTVDETASAIEGATGALEENNEVAEENVRHLEDMYDAITNLLGNELSLEQASINSRRALEDYNAALEDGEASALDREEAGLDLLEAYLREGEAAAENAETQATAAGRASSAVEEGKAAQIAALQELAGTMAPGSDLRRRLEEYIAALGRIPTNIQTRLELIDSAARQDAARARNLPGRAAGGSVVAGQAYMVGEHAPEVFVPTSSGRVFPITDAPTGGGDIVIRNVLVVDGKELAQAQARYDRKNGRLRQAS